MEITEQKTKILKILLKDFTTKHTITSLSKELKLTRQGTFKIIKSLEKEKFIELNSIGTGKTSIYLITLNWENLLTEKILNLLLTEEAMKNQRWLNNFSELENKTEFSILYGSILNNQKDAGDIDILNITDNFVDVDKIINKIQKTQIKHIHCVDFSLREFEKELKNKIFIDAIKKGVVLFGQENFIKFFRNF